MEFHVLQNFALYQKEENTSLCEIQQAVSKTLDD